MIRQANAADYADIAKLMQRFAESIGSSHDLAFFGDAVENLVDNGVVLVSDTDEGITGAILGKIVYDAMTGTDLLQEVAWYAEDNSGIFLLKAFIAKAREIGVASIYFSVLETSGERVHKAMALLNFIPVERSYRLTL